MPKLTKKKLTLLTGEKTSSLKVKSVLGKVKWKSSNNKIATVSSSGVVKGKRKGKVTITAIYGGYKLHCTVNVEKLEEKVPGKINASSIKRVSVSEDCFHATYKWKKVKGASGYQVAVDVDGISHFELGKYSTKKNKVKMWVPTIEDGYDNYKIKVRAYKIIRGKKIYGKWSVSSKFPTFFGRYY